MGAPVIGIGTASLLAMDGVTAPQPPSSVLGARYVHALAAAGAIAWPIPLSPADEGLLRSIYERLDGLLLPGGADIRPSEYRASAHAALDRGDPSRDHCEAVLAGWALEDAKPVLGICRGMQLINVVRGGTLVQDLSTQNPGAQKHDYSCLATYPRDLLVHEIRTTTGSRVHALLGTNRTRVNSLHHQAIAELGHDLVASAFAPDGVIEAVECPERPFVVGVQWHPEEIAHRPSMASLFEGFVQAATAFASGERGTRAPRMAVAG